MGHVSVGGHELGSGGLILYLEARRCWLVISAGLAL